MDIYLSSLVLGGVGLGAMALGGHFGHGDHGHGHGHGHGSHGHADGHGHGHAGEGAVRLLAWPRILFGFFLGLGAVGIAIKGVTVEPVTLVVAALGGLLFQRFVITPIWNFALRFESTAATTSEGVDEATAVTSFNSNGEGLVAIEVDGQVVQVLGRLGTDDRQMGVVVRAGQRLRVVDVNTSNNRCTVSAL
ncbi:MAG TPA: hypothetical protein VM100_04980 [Longimicrobiales bacterium]|nr:hypothetical protein [Longimicrobiales bacterium]